ncbi:MAG: ABC transporter ATP-binding protein [Mailhella sp.]|nr:ABC transporter ATP-binding protein [Mailhella sp.]
MLTDGILFFEGRDLFVRAGKTTLLEGVSFTLKRGGILMLAGRNGSGKTTLLRGLAGLSGNVSGNFFFRTDASITNIFTLSTREKARLFAFMPQHAPDHVPLTVCETVAMGRAPWQGFFGGAMPEDDGICRQAMIKTGIYHLKSASWPSLSGGERQRAVLARVLSQQTPLILLDEPTSALDYQHQQIVMDALRGECKRGVSIIMATHDLNLAALYADSVMLLDEGRSVACGSPAEVFTPELLEQAYHCRLIVDRHPCLKVPRISLAACNA